MSLWTIGVVYAKELRDLLRDRRTIISMVVVPVVVMPLMMTGLGVAATQMVNKVRRQTPKVMVLGGEDSPKTRETLLALKTFEFVPASQDFTNLISNKQIGAAVAIPSGFDAAVQSGQAVTVSIYTYSGEIKSAFAAQSINQFFEQMRDRIVGERLAARQVPRKVLTPFEIRQTNVASEKKVSGNVIGMIIPYMVIIMCMTGAIYPAVDLTAGEKERGTMETLLCSPTPRTHLVLGKALVVLTVSLSTAFLALASNAEAFMLLKGLTGKAAKGNALALTLDPAALAAVLALMVPLAVFFSGVMVAAGLFSRSAKEANSYLQPLVFLTIIPALAAAAPGVELNYGLALIPVVNVSLASKDIMSGGGHWNYVAVVFAAMSLYGALALAAAVALFNREQVLFRT
jgi:sodium transport system permease protein